jgi:hypothetical protein
MLPHLLGFNEINIAATLLGTFIFGFFGVLILAIWVPSSHDKPGVKEQGVKNGFLNLAIALAFLMFGIYFLFLAVFLLCIFIIYIIVEGLVVILKKNK